jgi:hypothetical protein
MREFIKKNFTIYHITGIVVGLIFAIFYWHIKGKFSDYILKNNLFLISIFGIVVGYITLDLVQHAIKKNK